MSNKIRASNARVPGFVAQLRQRRVDLGVTQGELAARLGWPRTRMGEYEIALRRILPRHLDAWAGELGMRIVAVPVEGGAA